MENMTRKVSWNITNKTNEQIKKEVRLYTENCKSYYTDLVISNGNVTFTLISNISYENLVNQLVKERYSDSEEFAILRKAINGITDEYRIYNLYVEECKTKAKQFIQERNSVLGE